MKVYITYYRDWAEFEILEVFESRELAETYIDTAITSNQYKYGSLFIMEKDVL